MILFIRAIWLFLWEVFMGRDTIKGAYRKDRKRFYMFLTVVVLSFYSVMVTRRLIVVSHAHLVYKQSIEAKQVETVISDNLDLVQSAKPIIPANTVASTEPVETPKPKPKRIIPTDGLLVGLTKPTLTVPHITTETLSRKDLLIEALQTIEE